MYCTSCCVDCTHQLGSNKLAATEMSVTTCEFDHDYIAATTARYHNVRPHILEHTILHVGYCAQKFRLRLIVFDPVHQLDVSLVCPMHGRTLRPSSRSFGEPGRVRPVYHTDGVVHVAASHYFCCGTAAESSHHIIATDEGLLQQVDMHMAVPFRLFHRSGATTELMQYITHRIMTGSRFEDLSKFLHERAMVRLAHDITERERTSARLGEGHVPVADLSSVLRFLGTVAPSADLLANIFVVSMKEHRTTCVQERQKHSPTVISMDHTFKVSANIGYVRPTDGSWVQQFNSLFCVLNAEGYVLSYQLVNSQSFDCVRQQLVDIHERGQSTDDAVQTVEIDNCCSWRSLLTDVFGSNTAVKLDLFHAVQRISGTFRANDPLKARVIRRVRQVFRRDGDSGVKRQMPTADAATQLKKLDGFVKMWRLRLNISTRLALQRLRVHIEKGCLENLAVGAGTNRNERLHRLLNRSAISVGRIGQELAESLLAAIVYAWNTCKAQGSLHTLFSSAAPMCIARPDTVAIGAALSTQSGEGTSAVVQLEAPHVGVTRVERAAIADTGMRHNRMHNMLAIWRAIRQENMYVRSLMTCHDLAIACLHACELLSPPQVRMNAEAPGLMQLRESGQLQSELIGGLTLKTGLQDLQQYAALTRTAVVIVTGNVDVPVVALLCDGTYDGHMYVGMQDDEASGVCRAVMYNIAKSSEQMSSVVSVATSQGEDLSCRCGASSKTESSCCDGLETKGEGNISMHAHGLKRKYKSRCKCLQNGLPCTLRCRCVRCDNPKGVHVAAKRDDDNGARRSRMMSKRPKLHRTSSKQYAEAVGTTLAAGCWTDIETMCLVVCRREMEAAASAPMLTAYNTVWNMCLSNGCSEFPREKSVGNIENKMRNVNDMLRVARLVSE